MNEKNIQDIIDALYELIQDARSVPLASDKCIIEREKVLDMLDQVIDQMPGELKQSRSIVENRAEIIGQARREAENLTRKAQEEAERLVSQEAIYQEAKRRCAEEVEQTKAEIARLHEVSNKYMDNSLLRTQDAIAQSMKEVQAALNNSLNEVQNTRAKFIALTTAQQDAPAEEEE